MLALFFLNPGFLFIAAALISVPIIIHLINRMRFKRIRWAAMEFLLKAAKRTRRRLIIEQLILLALRCLLIALIGLLVSRFIGCSDSNTAGKPNLHLVLLDDTLSMQDGWKHTDGTPKNCFDVAKTDIIIKEIAKGVSLNKTQDRLVILRLSKIDDKSHVPKAYERLNDKATLDALTQDINEMQPSMLHVNMLQGVKAAQQLMTNYTESAVTLHIISDYREVDWGAANGEGLTKLLLEMVQKNKDVKIRAIDTVDPPRGAGEGSAPKSRDNVGIVDFRPSTRVVGKKVAVKFTIAIKNFSSKQVETHLVVRNEVTGKDLLAVDFTPINPVKLSPGTTTEVTFERGDLRNGLFFDDIKPGQSEFAHLSVRLADAQMQPLAGDGLLADNIRHTVIEVRDTVPILIIDGQGKEGREENKDSFMLARGAISQGKSYEVEFGDMLAPGNPAKALERADLGKYPLIYLLNVRDLNAKQAGNLETYVKEGGGVAFFMGPAVNAGEYNKTLYKGGAGVFPAPLMKEYYPKSGDPELPTKESDTYQLITRDDQFPNDRLPIFSEMFPESRMKMPLRIFPVHRYFKVDRAAWKPEKGWVFELATLPNDDPADKFNLQLGAITQGGQAIAKVRETKEFQKYGKRFDQLLRDVELRVQPGREFKAYHLAEEIEKLLTDKGQKGVVPDMSEFWASPDPNIQTLQGQLTRLREQVHYGDPFVVAQTYGKGRVVAVMSTAGKDWNKWSGGSLAEPTYPMFVVEMQNWLSSPGEEGNLTVGTNLELTLDAEPFQGKRLKLVRNYWKTEPGLKAIPEEKKRTEERGEPNENGKIVFAMTKHDVPGLYTSELFEDDAAAKPIAKFAHAFNVDTLREGQLQRVGSEDLERDLIARSNGLIKMVSVNSPDGALVAKTDDLSESPWLFLILLLVLVAEQALAVHLSFHLKNTENEITPAGAKS